jgi:phospholipid-binding lipoprotein MlaA
MTKKALRHFLLPVAIAALLAGCATPPPASEPEALADFQQNNDPLEPTNRVIFQVNDVIFTDVLHPVGSAYRWAGPDFGRQLVANFLANLKSPTSLLNDVLQGNFSRAVQLLERVALNSSFGVGGIMDVATPMGIARQDADFGQTLAVWGVGEGPYLVVPLFGGSNPRDVGGLLVDSVTDPLDDYFYTANLSYLSQIRFGASVVSLVESNMDGLDDIKRSSLDYYSAMRSLYRQRRRAEIRDATSPGIGWFRVMPHMNLQLQNIF